MTSVGNSVMRLLARCYSRAALPYLAAALLIVAAVVLGGREAARHIGAVESWLSAWGPWAVPAYALFFALVSSFLVPDTLLCIVAGAVFGPGRGFAAVIAGSLLGASLQFALSHYFLKGRIEKFIAARPSLAVIRRAVAHDEFRLQVLLRLTPLNPATVSYVLGASGVRFPGFIGACLAITPHLVIGVLFGHAGRHATLFASDGSKAARLHELVLFSGLVASIVVMALISRIARKALSAAVNQTSAD